MDGEVAVVEEPSEKLPEILVGTSAEFSEALGKRTQPHCRPRMMQGCHYEAQSRLLSMVCRIQLIAKLLLSDNLRHLSEQTTDIVDGVFLNDISIPSIPTPILMVVACC